MDAHAHALLSQAKQQLARAKQREQSLKMTVTVLLSRSESQILVLETLLKRLVQVCVQTQDKRLAKELKLIDFTRLAKRLSNDHVALKRHIGGDESQQPESDNGGGDGWAMQSMEDGMGQQAQFQNQPIASTSGRMGDGGQGRRHDSASLDAPNNNGLSSMFGNNMGMQSMQSLQGIQGSFGNSVRGGSNQMLAPGNRNVSNQASGSLGGMGGYSGF